MAIPIRPCPRCQTPTVRLLELASKQAWVFYYRCEVCGHVWNIPKNDPDAPPRDVIIAPDKKGPANRND